MKKEETKKLPIRIGLPEAFLEEEERCGFLVSRETKEIWAVELDLYAELSRVCDKYNLKLLADAGTILGAVRHTGFIPWDDDMDLSMSREDYVRLCEVAEQEFKYPYFWQTEETDPGSCRGHGQLRNSETTAILSSEKDKNYKFNQGIFIDVFPFDMVPDDFEERQRFLKQIGKGIHKRNLYRDMSIGINTSNGVKRIIKKVLIDFWYRNKEYNNKHHAKLEILKQKYSNTNNNTVANLLFVNPQNTDLLVRPKIWFDDYKEVPFENTTIKVPACYDEYLKKTYGNWHKFVVGNSIHGDVIFDVNRSFKETLKEMNK